MSNLDGTYGIVYDDQKSTHCLVAIEISVYLSIYVQVLVLQMNGPCPTKHYELQCILSALLNSIL